MNANQPLSDDAPTDRAQHVIRALTVLAVCAAIGTLVLLACREISTPDLGYHLTYGERFWETLRPVDHDQSVYTLPDDDAERADAPPGPGAWYDEDGRYRFANANWLTQVVMSAAEQVGGDLLLWALLPAMVAGIAGLSLSAMRRSGVGWTLAAGGLLLMGLVAYPRFLLRPELFGYAVLAAQLCLLLPLGDTSRRVSWPVVGGVVALQLVLVNLHSYWGLGLALTGTVLVDRLVRLLWGRVRRGSIDAEMKRDTLRMGTAVVGGALVAFVNPWTWRLAVLPIETLQFMRANDIGGGQMQVLGHPWSRIGEFYSPFSPHGFAETTASYAYHGLLVLAGRAALAAIWRRRWSWLLMIVGMTLVSMSMWRNIAIGAVVVGPVALAALVAAFGPLTNKLKGGAGQVVAGAGAAVVLIVAGWLGSSVASSRFYYRQRLGTRTGVGLSSVRLSLPAIDWLNEHQPSGRLFCDYDVGSNLHYFTSPHREVPIVTNTWAYPPKVMETVERICSGRKNMAMPFFTYRISTVVLRVEKDTAPLASKLAAAPGWAMVHLDSRDAVFLRTTGPDAALAREHAIDIGELDVDALASRLRKSDPGQPATALHSAAALLHKLVGEAVRQKMLLP
ncbi:MAG: hypothetical protein ACOC93_03670, partial [Planctomycetota bacterium]